MKKFGAFAKRVAWTNLFVRVLLIALLVAPMVSFAEDASSSVMKRGSFRLPAGASVDDVVVYGGIVEIMGEVNGSIFVVEGKLFIQSKAVVHGNITVISSDLKLAAGSTVKGSVFVMGGEISREEGAVVEGKIDVKKDEVSFDTRRLLMQYMIFSRPTPFNMSPADAIKDLSETVRIWNLSAIAQWKEISVAGLPAIALPENAARPASIGLWSRHDWELRIGIAQLDSNEAAAELWKRIYVNWNKANVRDSVHVGLGDGAHWFFSSGDRSAALWKRNRYLILVEVGPAPGEREIGHLADILKSEVLMSISRRWSQN